MRLPIQLEVSLLYFLLEWSTTFKNISFYFIVFLNNLINLELKKQQREARWLNFRDHDLYKQMHHIFADIYKKLF